MIKIYRIAKAELSSFFYSPIAWFVLIIFIFQSSLLFLYNVKDWLQLQDANGDYFAILNGGLSFSIFNGPGSGFLPKIQATLYFYLPVLTMGLISRELSSGSIKLLLSSPVKVRQIILGKFGAMLIYCFLFILVLFLFFLAANFSIQNMDRGLVLSELLGTYLMICAYAAIGLFMSSLTSYQIVAAISTLVVFGVLEYIDKLWQNMAFIRMLSRILSLKSQILNFNNGLISSSDVLYYFLIIGLFLCLAIMRMNDGRELRTWPVKVVRYSLLITVFVLLGYVSSRPDFKKYYDATANKNQTLSPNSLEVIKKIKEPLKVTLYTNLLDEYARIGLPENRNKDYTYWERYTRFMPEMQFNYVYYYDTSDRASTFLQKVNVGLTADQLAKKNADALGYDIKMFLTPAEMKNQLDLEHEDHKLIRQIELGNKRTFLRTYRDGFNDHQPLEREITAAIKRLVVDQPPKLYFLSGHNERSIMKEDDDQYKYLANDGIRRSSLINLGFDVDTLDLKTGDMPSQAATVVIADPQIKFAPEEQQKLFNYIDQGGNLVIAADTDAREELKPLLDHLGIRMMDGVLIQPSKNFGPEHIAAEISDIVGDYFDKSKLIFPGRVSMTNLFMNGAVGLEYENKNGFYIRPIVVTDMNKAWNKKGHIGRQISFRPEEGDSRQTIPVVLAVTRNVVGREQRIIVTGDADFMSNVSEYYDTDPFTMEIFRWMNYGEFPLDTSFKTNDNDFKINQKELSALNIILIGILPIILFIFSAVLLIRRRRA